MASILLVDDDERLLELGKEFLELDSHHSVITANCVDSAMTIIGSTNIDVIVSDYQMPNTDGIEFLKTIRRRKDHVPFILFTGKGREEVVIQAINEGVDYYIKKGTDVGPQYAQLLHTIDQAFLRKQAEESITYNLNLFKELIENAADVILITDENGKIEYGSPSIKNVLGFTENEYIGQNGSMFLNQEMQRSLKQEIADVSIGMRPCVHELELKKKDGNLATVEFLVKTVERNGSKKFIFNLKDVSERKERDCRLKELMKEIKVQREDIERELRSGAIGGIGYDFSTKTVTMTPNASELLGLDKNKGEFDIDALLSMVHEDDLEIFRYLVDHADCIQEPIVTWFRIIKPSGEIKNIVLTSCTMKEGDDTHLKMHGVLRDLTELIRLQRKIEMTDIDRSVLY